jgi:glycerophosphoryl diester phosphodiesterase
MMHVFRLQPPLPPQVGNLKYLAQKTDLPLVQLLGGWPEYVTPDTGATHEQMTTDSGLDDIAQYASGIGLWKDTILPTTEERYIGPSTGLVQRIQSRGMQVRLQLTCANLIQTMTR